MLGRRGGGGGARGRDLTFKQNFVSNSLPQGFKCWSNRSFPGSAGLTIWQKRHMPRAPRFWGPRAYSLLFFRIFLFHLSVRDPNSAPVRGHKGAIKSSNPPENARAIKFKKRGPIKLGPNVFVSCFSVSARGPKEPKVLRKSQAPKFKKPETGFLFPVSAQDPNSAGPQRVQGPQKRSPQIKKTRGPKV